MATRIIPDHDKPSVAIELSLEKPLPDYDLEEVDLPTPREVDGVLVSQGFRDLVDDARGVLLEILCQRPHDFASESSRLTDLGIAAREFHPMEITQLTGAICPGNDGVYRPGLWIVVMDTLAPANQPLPAVIVERVKGYAETLAKRLDLH
jgi:hypothetical protein